MAEYIRREDAIDDLHTQLMYRMGSDDMKRRLDDWVKTLPAADVVPVVHGHWEYIDDTYCGFKDTDVRCSVCKTTTNIKRFRKTKWCPDCGAKMDGERKEEYEAD